MTKEKTNRPRAVKLYVVTDADGNSVYVKAKTKTIALNFIIGKHFKVDQVAPKDMVKALDAVAKGAEIHEATE